MSDPPALAAKGCRIMCVCEKDDAVANKKVGEVARSAREKNTIGHALASFESIGGIKESFTSIDIYIGILSGRNYWTRTMFLHSIALTCLLNNVILLVILFCLKIFYEL